MFRSARTSSISSAAAILNPTPFIKSRKLETYAKKDKSLNAQNAKIETAKKDRAEKASNNSQPKVERGLNKNVKDYQNALKREWNFFNLLILHRKVSVS